MTDPDLRVLDRAADRYPSTVTDPSPSTESGHRSSNRRAVLATAGSVIAGAVAGCNAYPPERRPRLAVQLADVREATAPYDHPLDAMADGFQALGPFEPGRGWHVRHPERTETVVEEGFDRERPNWLAYHVTEAGFELGAAVWAGPSDDVPEEPDLFDDTDDSEQWHVRQGATHVFAFPDDEQTDPQVVAFSELVRTGNWAAFRPPDADLQAGDRVALNWGSLDAKRGERTERVADLVTTLPDRTVLYAWVHTENPDGVFNPTNPRIE